MLNTAGTTYLVGLADIYNTQAYYDSTDNNKLKK